MRPRRFAGKRKAARSEPPFIYIKRLMLTRQEPWGHQELQEHQERQGLQEHQERQGLQEHQERQPERQRRHR